MPPVSHGRLLGTDLTSPTSVQKCFFAEALCFESEFPPLRIEILTSLSGVTFRSCWPRRTVAEIDGIPVNLISLKDLKKNKRASGRLKDLDDLENLP
jgi:hypothetical protein